MQIDCFKTIGTIVKAFGEAVFFPCNIWALDYMFLKVFAQGVEK